MINKAKTHIVKIVQESIERTYSIRGLLISVERTKDEKFGDFSTNAAMMHSHKLKESPMSIGKKLCKNIQQSLCVGTGRDLSDIKLVKPGFLVRALSISYIRETHNVISC